MRSGDLPLESQPLATSLLSTFHDILQLLEHGADVALTFFDLRKAFDSVPHLPLLQKLKDIGLEQHVLQWLTSYLSDRQQRVVVDGATSNVSPVWGNNFAQSNRWENIKCR